MDIRPINLSGSHKTGGLRNINVHKITAILGFAPNIADDPDKVVSSWGFTVNGIKCGIWDYKGSHKYGQFSTYGPSHIFTELFGSCVTD